MIESAGNEMALYAAVQQTDAFIVGAANAGTGVHRYDGGAWTPLGWRNVRCNALAADPTGVIYMAAGNGVFRSLDGGATWRITTSWWITETQDVAVDPTSPDNIYAATAYGVWRSPDRGDSWFAASRGIPEPESTFVQTIVADDDGHVIIGTETGLFRSTDGAESWHPVGPPDVAIRDLHQSAADAALWLAGTEDCGVLVSRDGGESWRFADGEPGAVGRGSEVVLERVTFYAVALDPTNPARMAAGGYGTGVLESTDGGRHWAPCGTRFPNEHVHALAFDPRNSGLWAGTTGAGVYVLDENGMWRHVGLAGSSIRDLEFFALQAVPRDSSPLPPRMTPAVSTHHAARPTNHESRTTNHEYASRREALIDFFATRGASGYIDRVDLIEVAARLYRDRPLEEIVPLLGRLLEKPEGDMFWMVPMVLVQYLGRERLPEEYHRLMRELWRTYTPYRGDTENHWVMYYAALYLITQLYPDEPGASWYNGRSSSENFEEAGEYLVSWMDLTVTKGQGEFDSPHYLAFFLAPLALLYAFADDAQMQQRAKMMLDYLISDFAVDTLNGLYVGAFSRVYPEPLLDRWKNGSTSLAWLFFGSALFNPSGVNVILEMTGYRPHGMALILAVSGYAPPEIIRRIATERSTPYVHRELKRTRHRIRYSALRNVPVYKYLYLCRDYAVGSIQGGLLQPIQQHTWEVFWADDDPTRGHTLLFAIHPYSDAHELAMYFPEEGKLLTQAVLKEKKETYDSASKWTGGSPYEQILQHEDAVVALYDIPEGTRFPYVCAFFSRELSYREESPSGWIFSRGGDAFIAYHPLAPFEWQQEEIGDWRLFSPHLKNGAVVQVAPVSDFGSMEAFREAVLRKALATQIEPVPRVRFETLRGAVIEAAYGEIPRVNGVEVDYDAWPLFDGPHLHSERGTRKLELRHGEMRRTLDFNTLRITNSTNHEITIETGHA